MFKFISTVLIIGLIALGFNYANLNNIQTNNNLSRINSNIVQIKNDVDFLYSYADITENGETYAVREGTSVMGLNAHNKYILLVTGDRSNKQLCNNFLHELGHEQCKDLYDDSSEDCAEEFRLENNSWRDSI